MQVGIVTQFTVMEIGTSTRNFAKPAAGPR